jgi:hypothetical protein
MSEPELVESNTKPDNEIDYLTEDTPLRGQEWGVYSFLSPEGVKGTNIRAFKNRGNFGTQEEASKHAEKIRNEEPAFSVFVGENFKWTVFDPNPDLVKDNLNYYEPKLQELMRGTIENQEKTKQVESQRKRDMIEKSIREEITKSNVKPSVRDRLKKKLKERNNKQDDKKENKEDNSKPLDLDEEIKNNDPILDENLEKMKKLYADLLNKKKQE